MKRGRTATAGRPAGPGSGLIRRRRFIGASARGVVAMAGLLGWAGAAVNRSRAAGEPAAGTGPAATNAGALGKDGGRELLRDPGFREGFRLIEPTPGRRVVTGTIGGSAPVWDLDQWSSRHPLKPGAPTMLRPGVRSWRNAGQSVVVGEAGTDAADLALGVNAVEEYRGRARRADEPWVHLLVEQEFVDPPSLAAVQSVRLRFEARLLRSELRRTGDYSPDRHAAQFQMFITVQNRNRQSPGHGRLLWFGVPIYDDRSPFPREHKARDTGGTSMFIYTPAGSVFTDRSAHGGEWIRIDKDLRPLMLEALETAWSRGFLLESRAVADYRLTTTNLGWEVPGLFDVEMQVRGLSLRVSA